MLCVVFTHLFLCYTEQTGPKAYFDKTSYLKIKQVRFLNCLYRTNINIRVKYHEHFFSIFTFLITS